MPKFIAGTARDELSIAICKAVGLEPGDVRRILIDLEAGAAARVYYETFADTDKLAAAVDAWRAADLGTLEIVDDEPPSRLGPSREGELRVVDDDEPRFHRPAQS